MRRVDVHVNDHRRYQVATEEYATWLDGAAEKLQTLHNSAGTKDDVESRLNTLRVGINYIL